MTTWHWLSSERMTIAVEVRDYDPYRIVTAPPIARKFIGQPFTNLVYWMQSQPGLRGGRL